MSCSPPPFVLTIRDAAFDAGAVDYVLKPISEERLALACTRLRSRLAAKPIDLEHVLAQIAAGVAASKTYLRWITASVGASIRMITIDEVCFFQSDIKYTQVGLAKGEALIHMSLKQLLDALDPAIFWQIHRSTIVNVHQIDTIGRDGDGHVVLRLKRASRESRVSSLSRTDSARCRPSNM